MKAESPSVLSDSDGEWARTGLLWHWKPARKIADLIACPVCLAKITELCKTPNGWAAAEHEERLVSVRCSCGNPMATEECRRAHPTGRQQRQKVAA